MSDLRVTVKRQKTGDYTASAPTTAPSKPPRRPQSILDYLCSLSSHTLTQLYRDPFTVLTIFRSLPPLSKHFILRLVCLATPPSPDPTTSPAHPLSVEKSLVDGWCRGELTAQQAHHQAITRLLELQIFIRTTLPPSAPSPSDTKAVSAYRLNHTFAGQLQLALTNQVADLDDDPSTSAPTPSLNTDELTTYASHRWNQLLHFMVGVRTLGAPSASIQTHLLAMQLMASVGGKVSITPAGFSFLFKDQHTQVWDLLLTYVAAVNAGSEREEVLTFLFHLAFMRVGREYPRAKLSPAQRRMVDDLAGFGLLMLKPSVFIPTHLVYNLSSSASTPSAPPPTATPALSSALPTSGYLIVETTFKVYAYTTSAFQLSLLNLFLRFDYHLPNLLVASITKESVRNALIHQITTQEIITYLEQYAHPCMKSGGGGSILPENVVDALRLWEAERERMEVSDQCCLLSEFEGEREYKGVLEELRKGDWVIYYNDSKRSIVTTEEGVQAVKEYRAREGGGAAASGGK